MTWSGGCWRRLIAESMSFLGYFNFKNILFQFLHSCKRKSCVDDVVVTVTVFSGCQPGLSSEEGALYLFSFCKRGFQSCRQSIIGCYFHRKLNGRVGFIKTCEQIGEASERSRTRASVSSMYLLFSSIEYMDASHICHKCA